MEVEIIAKLSMSAFIQFTHKKINKSSAHIHKNQATKPKL